ncbi:MAG: hypothetical protein ABIK83_04160 [Candidatus Zixiibacteriota bacterium]
MYSFPIIPLATWGRIATKREDNPMRQKTIGIFKNEKQPKTAAEMAAVMAYYLKELALGDEWKDSVSADDVTSNGNNDVVGKLAQWIQTFTRLRFPS